MREDRLVRLLDLEPYEVVVVNCQCGRSVESPNGLLQRRHRLQSDTLVYDLQFKLRCQQCRRTSSFRIAVYDSRQRGENSKPRRARIDRQSVVAGKRVSAREELGGRGNIKKKKKQE